MGIQINRPLLNQILVDFGASKEGAEALGIEIEEEPELLAQSRYPLIGLFARFRIAFLNRGYYWFNNIHLYKTRIELEFFGRSLKGVLAHECGHFLDPRVWEKIPWRNIILGRLAALGSAAALLIMGVVNLVNAAAARIIDSSLAPDISFVLFIGSYLSSLLIIKKLNFLEGPEERADKIAKKLLSDPRWKDVIVEGKT